MCWKVYFVSGDMWRYDLITNESALLVHTSGDPLPTSWTELNDTLFVISGEVLWATDGTVEGTHPVRQGIGVDDVVRLGNRMLFHGYYDDPGSGELYSTKGIDGDKARISHSDLPFGTDPYWLTVTGDHIFFAGADDAWNNYHNGLWRSDGTPSGTRLVTRFAPTTVDTSVCGMTAVAGELYLGVGLNGESCQPWVSDGTSRGTLSLGNIRLGTDFSDPSDFYDLDGTLMFNADDGEHGKELWKSDGTSEGTQIVKDIYPGNDNNPIFDAPSGLEAIGKRLFFFADDAVHGREPWITDATPEGTHLITDIRVGSEGSAQSFAAARALPGTSSVLFGADDGIHGFELWRSDGTASGTTLIKDLRPGPDGSGVSNLGIVGNQIFFTASSVLNTPELWVTDGSAEGTTRLAFPASNPTAIEGDIFFTSDQPAYGSLWRVASDRTVSRIGSYDSASILGSAGDHLIFLSRNDESQEIGYTFTMRSSDGTAEGTEVLGTFPLVTALASLHDKFLFYIASKTPPRHELWETDGTAQGTLLIHEFVGTQVRSIIQASPFQDKLYLITTDPNLSFEIWKTDATAAGTSPIASFPDVHLPYGSGLQYRLTRPLLGAGDHLFFLGEDYYSGDELWAINISATTTCSGDCDGDGSVTVTDLVRLINIALGQGDLESCRAADSDQNGTVTVDEIVTTVRSALSGCR